MISLPLHLVGLLLPGIWLGRVFRLRPALHLGAVFLIFEASLVLGAGLLSTGRLLGHQHAYQVATTLMAVGLTLCIWFFAQKETPAFAVLTPSETGTNSVFPTTSTIWRFSLGIVAALLIWIIASRSLMWAESASYRRSLQIVTMLVVLAIAISLCPFALRLIRPHPDWASTSHSNRPINRFFVGLLSLAPFICLAAFAALMLWMALNNVPAIEDALTIKLPKIVFAIESNSILPSDLTDDQRMYISPIYPALIQLFLIINGYDTHTLLVFGFVNWVVCAAAIYQMCRCMEVSKWASWTTVALVVLSPMMIAQGSSENDDIIGATPLIVALAFLVSWLHTNRRLDAIFVGIGAGLSVGIKLLPLLYVPAIVLILALALTVYSASAVITWMRVRARSAWPALVAFVFVLLPHAIANWVAFGNPLYVSSAVAATRNLPFSLDCTLRSLVGYSKQFIFSDLVRLISRVLAAPSHDKYLTYRADVTASNELFSSVLPYDPTPTCSAWNSEFAVTNWYANDTYWFGVFGCLVLICALFVLVSRRQPLLVRSLGLAFLVWAAAFIVTQKYIDGVGRYWSVAVLAASPIVAVVLGGCFRDGAVPRLRAWAGLVLVGSLTVLLAFEVLLFNPYRSVIASAKPTFRYIDGFDANILDLVKNTGALNIQVMYGIDTYDYYALRGRDIRFLNKATVVDDSVNMVVVRPYGVTDNPFADPRIPVRAYKPFAGGFRYVGPVPSGLGFANNTELTDGEPLDPRSRFLLFQLEQVRKDGASTVGFLHQIASTHIAAGVRYRAGWRNAEGDLVMDPEWHQGIYSPFKVASEATKFVVQVAIGDAASEVGSAEWPMTGFDPLIINGLMDSAATP